MEAKLLTPTDQDATYALLASGQPSAAVLQATQQPPANSLEALEVLRRIVMNGHRLD